MFLMQSSANQVFQALMYDKKKAISERNGLNIF